MFTVQVEKVRELWQEYHLLQNAMPPTEGAFELELAFYGGLNRLWSTLYARFLHVSGAWCDSQSFVELFIIRPCVRDGWIDLLPQFLQDCAATSIDMVTALIDGCGEIQSGGVGYIEPEELAQFEQLQIGSVSPAPELVGGA